MTDGKEKEMRMKKKNHAAGVKNHAAAKSQKKNRQGRNEFKKNPFINLKEEALGTFPGNNPANRMGSEAHAKGNDANHMSREDARQMAQMLEGLLEEIFGKGMEGCEGPIFGVIDFDPEHGMRLEIQEPKESASGKKSHGNSRKGPVMPPCDGCGEEVFQEMLGDLNYLAKMILEADFLMKMVCDENVDPEDARCITYLSVHEAREIMKKWDAYRRCEL